MSIHRPAGAGSDYLKSGMDAPFLGNYLVEKDN